MSLKLSKQEWELAEGIQGLPTRAELQAEITSLRAQLEEARAQAIEECARIAADAHTEYWRISNEHETHWRAWRQSGDVGEMPTISLGPMSDFIASRIRALLSAPTEARSALEASK